MVFLFVPGFWNGFNDPAKDIPAAIGYFAVALLVVCIPAIMLYSNGIEGRKMAEELDRQKRYNGRYVEAPAKPSEHRDESDAELEIRLASESEEFTDVLPRLKPVGFYGRHRS